MDQINYTAILQIALWKKEGMSELEIRQFLAKLVKDDVIQTGLKLSSFLDSIKISDKEDVKTA